MRQVWRLIYPKFSPLFLEYADMRLSRILTITGILCILNSVILFTYSCKSVQNVEDQKKEQNSPTKPNKINNEIYPGKEDYRTAYNACKQVHKWITPSLWNHIYKYSTTYGISPGLTAALIWHESEGKYWAKGPYVEDQGRAYGLMQIMPKYHYRGNKEDLLNPKLNISIGTKLLASFIRKEKGNLTKALKDYNSGPGSKYYNKPYIKGILTQYSKYKQNLKNS
jgi:soluble lytic murein transglycosylase-like protein